jgi:hypothetical protein
MRSGGTKIFIIVILLAAVFFARIYRGAIHNNNNPVHDRDQSSHISPGYHQSAIDPNSALIYTHHARCRMECRHISERDIREVLQEGYINSAKSEQNPGPCPTYAIEENRHTDGVRLRIIFAKCGQETRVVTCIDRDHEYACDCK